VVVAMMMKVCEREGRRRRSRRKEEFEIL